MQRDIKPRVLFSRDWGEGIDNLFISWVAQRFEVFEEGYCTGWAGLELEQVVTTKVEYLVSQGRVQYLGAGRRGINLWSFIRA